MCACLRQSALFLTLKTANNRAIPSTYRHFLNSQHHTINLSAPFHTRIAIYHTYKSNTLCLSVVCVVCVMLSGMCLVLFHFCLLFVLRSPLNILFLFLCASCRCALFLWCIAAVLIAVSHQLIALCLSSISIVLSLFYRYLLLFIVYRYFLYILCFYICCNFFFFSRSLFKPGLFPEPPQKDKSAKTLETSLVWHKVLKRDLTVSENDQGQQQ